MLITRSLKRLASTRYPGFVFGLPLREGSMPAFIYHEVEAETFAADLEFLKCNGYATLSTEEYVRSARSRDAHSKGVLLTFDDARANFFEVALPILRQFNAQATLFVPTYWIGDSRNSPPSPSIPLAEAALFMTWDQVRLCRDSGLVDVQSHGHRHALVHTSTRLVGFASPERLEQSELYDWPMRRNNGLDRLGRPPLGTPIYVSDPLLSASFRLLEDSSLARSCQQLVADGGDTAFFHRPDWEQRLRTTHKQSQARFERIEGGDFLSLVASEFQLSQQHFENELGSRPRFFAYPWMLGSAASLRIASELGIQAVFGVGLDFNRAEKMDAAVPAFGRFKADWLRFLPGHARAKLGRVVRGKFGEWMRTQNLAH